VSNHTLPALLAASLAAASLFLGGCQPQAAADFPRAPFSRSFEAAPTLPFTGPLLAVQAEPETPFMSPAPAATPAVRMWTDWEGEALPGYLRSQRAIDARLPVVKDLFAQAGVAFPPAEIAFVAYKQENQLEVWASAEKGGRAERIATYGICAASGVLGPKRYEGDRQVPEGYYVLQYGWAESNYHLEMKVSYPNMVDKVLGPRTKSLGGEIMIHGACASIGCLAMGDERAEELWVMMKTMGDARVKVHIYPARDMASLLRDPEYAQHHAFWQNLKEGRDRFEREHRFPSVKADWHGVYMYE
jgi:hypothetical protein